MSPTFLTVKSVPLIIFRSIMQEEPDTSTRILHALRFRPKRGLQNADHISWPF